jgi:hypothetical protein
LNVHRSSRQTFLVIFLVAASAAAQTGTVPLDSGTPPSGFTNSNITVSGGSVGIATTSPINKLQVTGGLIGIDAGRGAPQLPMLNLYENLSLYPGWTGAAINLLDPLGSYGGGIAFNYHPANGVGDSNHTTGMVLNYAGNIGIGTTSPQQLLAQTVRQTF